MGIRIIHADVMEGLQGLPDASVHCVVTSPPYWGLRCYGTDGQLGLEPTLAEHIAKLVEVFEEVRRVLRPDGVLFLNYGDVYATSQNGRSAADTKALGNDDRTFRDKPFSTVQGKLKAKDNCLLPERLALALHAQGWYVRDRIIWAKPNPMPSSVTDRCTPSYELVYMLTRSARYWWDAEAIKEPAEYGYREHSKDGAWGNKYELAARGTRGTVSGKNPETGRNCRNVWTIPTHPMPEAHFATFPPRLVERCLLAACPERACAECGAGWVRETESSYEPAHDSTTNPNKGNLDASSGWSGFPRLSKATKTLGWSPSCTCQAETTAGTCLDPFGGSGTVGLVADRMNRNAILIELSKDYCDMARRRIEGDAGLFANVELTA